MASANSLTVNDLPIIIQARYLGSCKAQGLWGIKHTRKPVDILVESAKANRHPVPIVEIKVSVDGLQIVDLSNRNVSPVMYNIDSISYGVQDLNFTRVFSMIICNTTPLESATTTTSITKPKKDQEDLFMCHAFACDSKQTARQLTFALSAAFKHYADMVKLKQDSDKLHQTIDLRMPGQIDEESETEA